ncbi:L-glyceraldehyde 3-phosphate reductase [Pontibacter sp. G13]|uniref:L-glyceraldehyde 3-phosphate reductase n=1 Tax=Pontibacter sp. G13 TaxID=3074898 RepID=UPI00288A948B|nr:L-glyceraldehyde 3-phosphate reductase [Pontibacter sp. G13]WNJ18481.1 L-glyceraldehyde 3-phosphate reductase [Pontibacter sp. G13]
MPYHANDSRYDQMKTRRAGKSGLILPALSLGLWHNFGHVDRYQDIQEILRYAFDRGIFHFDLANNYGPPPGSAEENFGRVFREDFRPYRDEMIISSKAGYRMWPGPFGEWGSRKYLLASLDQSLQRMGLEYVDIFYSHRFDPDTPLEETMGALDHAVRSGKALYAGISSYTAAQTREAARILKDLGTPCVIHQPKYNMFDRWIETDHLVEALDDTGMGSIVFSPLAQGLLTSKYLKGIPEGSRAALDHGFLQKSEITEKLLTRVQALNDLAASRNQTLAQMALMWCWRLPQVTSVLVGVSSLKQLKDNLGALEHSDFTEEEVNQIEQILQG